MSSNVYNIEDRRPGPERPLGETLHEAINEFKLFIETRFAMLRSEMRENIANLKFAAPLLVAGAIFGVSAWLLWTGALVAVISTAFRGNPFGAFYALVIVGALYSIVAACAIWMAMGRLSKKSIMPERTINVLKEDKVWLQQESRTQL